MKPRKVTSQIQARPDKGAQSNFDRLMERLEDPEVQASIKNAFDITITDIKHIRVRPAAQKDELAIEIAPQEGKSIHLIVKGHYA
ncbi:MAG: hypothetical protein NC548_06155 [Lachnospiraceae bacterium]|nr:hypothetical protein [Lachnospiraceae bacterium]